MKKTYYFLSGLPRTGSTLLSAILNQNPRFHSEPASPVLELIQGLERTFISSYYYRAFPKENSKNQVLLNCITSYYCEVDKPVIFDKNRSWTNHIDNIIYNLEIKTPKIICTVRDVKEIVGSFLNLIHKNSSYRVHNFVDQYLMNTKQELTDLNRSRFILNNVIMTSYSGLLRSYNSSIFKNFIHIVEYDDLITNPDATLKELYEFLEEDYFCHNFTNIEQKFVENDERVYGLNNMHSVLPSVNSSLITSKAHLVPPEILKTLENIKNFWKPDQQVSTHIPFLI